MTENHSDASQGTTDGAGEALGDEALRVKVQAVFDQQINPSVAMHGGYIALVDVRDTKVFIEMGGGCQGCGAANLTLKAGVEAILLEEVPEVTGVIDTTDHGRGDNPYIS
ncbi:MAG: NifU family protein [Deltaproteobacteria bacterium]|nr:NifU family protein [Deltaproteobacteria bacterium]